jgi:ABC-type multidrug transport system fused ATPase/permease subunit
MHRNQTIKGIRMPQVKILRKLISKYKYRLAVTYGLFSLEMTGALLRPFFLGMAINDLIKGSYQGLIYLCVVHLAWLLIGMVRQMYDTRTYTQIYTGLVTRFLSRRYATADTSKLSAHSTLSREIVDFLETDLPYVVEAMYNIFGSLLLLYFYDSNIVWLCLGVLLPVTATSYFYGKKMRKLTQHKNDELENQVNVIAGGQVSAIHKHYNQLRNWQVKISDKEAWSFGMIELLVLIVIGASLLISVNNGGGALMAGNLVGIYAYVLKFVSGLDTIPYTMQRMATLQDISRRIALQEEDLGEPLRPLDGGLKEIKSASFGLTA